MRSIGEMARESGLGVSALRFYDRAGVLVPAWVDPVSGYRWYAPGQLDEARMLAGLRRAGMPLADIRLVTAGWPGPDTDLVRHLFDAHLRRLEQGLSDARDAFSALRSLLDLRENPVTTTRTATADVELSANGLAAALDAVRFAVSRDPELPMLAGVLLDLEGGDLHTVATDRYRMAVARTAVTGHGDGGRVQVVVPTALADAMRALSVGDGPVRLVVADGRVTLEAGDRQTAGRAVDHDFPDYRRLLPPGGGRRAAVDVAAFRAALLSGPARLDETGAYEVSVLRIDADGAVGPVAEGDVGEAGECVAVNRAYLLDALAALDGGGRDRLVLELGAPTAPIAVRRTDDEDAYSLLMPVRLED
ncbi:MerR family DNA-binding transcriptional regulator [Streptomyces sp. SID5785]|uniref:DNA polymerase III subunit beta family protein n=1 Tax=Streptomyces sp. SID5785 TaxID=2690309 RepID=UPI00136190F8|nr:MerR family transcriptional regulator [Streptomyces sp. SID5785]MZD06438.1 MerR family DNA-binding transcriptional regulator [Streptomyces sp. SID5785]